MFEIKCSFCEKVFLRRSGQINEGLKFGWHIYCSSKCQSKAKNKQKIFKCGNQNCDNIFLRIPSEIPPSGICFCSQSCAAKVSNKHRWLNLPKNYCANKDCGKVISRSNKFCSNKCQGIVKKFSDQEYTSKIIERIKLFYKNNKRIPFKKEMWGSYQAARRIFGTWNKAIIAAGFKPNPVKFAVKYIANDDHKCDSLAEKIIDDWLYARKIAHDRNIHYLDTKFTADFKVKNTLIEFFGLQGQLKRYDFLMKMKLRLIKENKLSVISIYPKDLFPKSKLNEILGNFVPRGSKKTIPKKKRLLLGTDKLFKHFKGSTLEVADFLRTTAWRGNYDD